MWRADAGAARNSLATLSSRSLRPLLAMVRRLSIVVCASGLFGFALASILAAAMSGTVPSLDLRASTPSRLHNDYVPASLPGGPIFIKWNLWVPRTPSEACRASLSGSV